MTRNRAETSTELLENVLSTRRVDREGARTGH